MKKTRILAVLLTIIVLFSLMPTMVFGEEQLIGIEITQPPYTLVYFTGQEFDPSGMIISALFDNDTAEEIDLYECSFSVYIFEESGMCDVTVEYSGETASFEVEVLDRTITEIQITQSPDKLIYYIGQEFDPTGMVISASFNDDTVEEIDLNECSFSIYIFEESGMFDIIVEYSGETASFGVEVLGREITEIQVTQLPLKLVYYTGQEFDMTGMEVSALFSDESIEEINLNECFFSVDLSTSGDAVEATVIYENFTAVIIIKVIQFTNTGIELISLPNKLEYNQGEELDCTGMKIKVFHNDGSTSIVDANSSMVSGYKKNILGKQTITVTYEDFSDYFPVNVIADGGQISVGTVKGRAGDTVNVSISITDNPGIVVMMLQLNYDKDILKLIGVSNTNSIFSNPVHTGDYNLLPFNMSWLMLIGKGINNTENGLLVTLTFEILADTEPGETDILISYAYSDVLNANYLQTYFDVKNGKVEILPPKKTGDVNEDEIISLIDVLLLRRFLVGGYNINEGDINTFNADVNNDAVVGMVDVLILRQYIVGGYNITLSQDGESLVYG